MEVPPFSLEYSGVYDRNLYLFAFGRMPEDKEYFKKRHRKYGEKIKQLNEYLQPILPGMLQKISDALGVPWEFNPVIIYVIPHVHKPLRFLGFSHPLTIVLEKWTENGTTPLSFDFITEVIIHELCHVIQRPLLRTGYYRYLLEKRGLKNLYTRNHFLTYAIQKKALGKEAYDEALKMYTRKIPAYQKAIDLVEEVGEDEIIAEARRFLE